MLCSVTIINIVHVSHIHSDGRQPKASRTINVGNKWTDIDSLPSPMSLPHGKVSKCAFNVKNFAQNHEQNLIIFLFIPVAGFLFMRSSFCPAIITTIAPHEWIKHINSVPYILWLVVLNEVSLLIIIINVWLGFSWRWRYTPTG